MNSGVKITDSQSEFRAFSASTKNIFHFNAQGMAIESEMLADAGRYALRVKKCPLASTMLLLLQLDSCDLIIFYVFNFACRLIINGCYGIVLKLLLSKVGTDKIYLTSDYYFFVFQRSFLVNL
jgi:hypothetical protein